MNAHVAHRVDDRHGGLAGGIVGSMALIAYAIGGNGRSRQQSNATVIAQMVSEKISSQKASLFEQSLHHRLHRNQHHGANRRRRRRIDERRDVDMTQAAVLAIKCITQTRH